MDSSGLLQYKAEGPVSPVMASTISKTQVISSPSRERATNNAKIFLAGSTNRNDDWRGRLEAKLVRCNIEATIFNPFRRDWDWPCDAQDERFREQVGWELEKQEAADLVVVYLCPGTKAPISLMELGLCAKTGPSKIVVCPLGYSLRGNVQMVCERYRIEMLDSEDTLADKIIDWVENEYTYKYMDKSVTVQVPG
ncbi:hypothetical protein TD95_003228 [Thielaviopsis punctulata]|uniref:NADPH-dependent FMN reductase-like domain-containing protein n=1 Tax=Thielaviopsis punctulata TaxID=72032 RepID=A0A0F4ZE41_9PEZI|nr:hypothetical protein TD95_003228 [Thielaviopsis punctulata]